MAVDLLAGATGLIGQALIDEFTASGREFLMLTRRPVEGPHQVVDFDALPEISLPVDRVDCVYCALGTTIARAGSREAFRKVDVDYVVGLAQWAERAGARALVVVSSVGADPDSGSFYLRCKGEMEREVAACQIPLRVFLRPSLLIGDRNEFRFGEHLAQWPMRLASPLLAGRLRRYRAIHATTVARAMVAACHLPPGQHGLEHDRIKKLAETPESR